MDTLHIEMLFNGIDKRIRTHRNIQSMLWVDHYKQVRSKWVRTEHIHSDDIEFLQHVTDKTFDELRHQAFMWGKWYDLTPTKVEYYNLYNHNREKKVKRCKHPVVFR